MKNNLLKEILDKKNYRPQSSFSLHNLPNLRNSKMSYKKNDENKEDSFDFKVKLIPKKEKENIYERNMDLKQEIKNLNKQLDFLKSNNHKLSQTITQKNKEIDDLTNQVILKNKELLTKEKLRKKSEISEKTKEKDNKKINKSNIFEKDLQLKKIYNELSITKEEYNKLVLKLKNKDEEILNLKTNKKITDYMEIKIKNEILTQEFNKLKEMYILSLDMNKKNENFGKNENILKAEIQRQHDIIIKLNQEIDSYTTERKKMMTEINYLKNKLELSLNNNKLIKNKKDNFEKKYRRNIKEQVIQKEYEEEKKEMSKTIKNLQKKLDYYRIIAMKEKDFGAIQKNKVENKNIIYNNVDNNIICMERKNQIFVRRMENPEENYDRKIMLMQSIITELTNNKQDLMKKLKEYEEQINNQTEKEKAQPKEKINLLKTTEEILKADNKEIKNVEKNFKNEEIEDNQNNINKDIKENEEGKFEEEEKDNESIKKEEINFEDIFSLNLEYKNINSSNAKNIFQNIFSKNNNKDINTESNKETMLKSLVNELSIKLNCYTKEEEKKEIYNYIKIYFEQDENFEEGFNIIFDNIINHEEESRKIIDQENESTVNKKFQKNKNTIETIISSLDNKIKINKFYEVLIKDNIYFNKDTFFYLCYKLKTEDCDSLYDIEIKGLSKYIK